MTPRRRQKTREKIIKTTAGNELLLLSPHDAGRYLRRQRVRSALMYSGGMMVWWGTVTVLYYLSAAPTAHAAAIAAAAVWGVGLVMILTACSTVLTMTPIAPLTRAELHSYPAHVATAIRIALGKLMPGDIDAD